MEKNGSGRSKSTHSCLRLPAIGCAYPSCRRSSSSGWCWDEWFTMRRTRPSTRTNDKGFFCFCSSFSCSTVRLLSVCPSPLCVSFESCSFDPFRLFSILQGIKEGAPLGPVTGHWMGRCPESFLSTGDGRQTTDAQQSHLQISRHAHGCECDALSGGPACWFCQRTVPDCTFSVLSTGHVEGTWTTMTPPNNCIPISTDMLHQNHLDVRHPARDKHCEFQCRVGGVRAAANRSARPLQAFGHPPACWPLAHPPHGRARFLRRTSLRPRCGAVRCNAR